jgi:N4-gp56 family major capsid protein
MAIDLGAQVANIMNKGTDFDAFVPEIWSDEILDALQHRLVMAKLVNTDFSDMVRGKGDVIHIPEISNLSANDKVSRAAVTVQTPGAESTKDITINKHKEVSFLLEDLAEIQTSVQLRGIYTRRAGYAIAQAIDTDLINEAIADFTVIDATSTTNAQTLAEDDVLIAKTILDENDCPADDRYIVVAPQQYNELLAIPRFTQADTVGSGQPIHTGVIGQLHGFTVWMTQQIAASGSATDATINNLAFHRDALALCMQMDPRVQANYIPEYLGWLVTADTVYGLNSLREQWGVVMVTDTITYTLSRASSD